MTKKQKILFRGSIAFALMFSIAPISHAMHIMEGYLPAMYCISWGVICLPFLVAGFFSIQKKLQQNRRTLPLLAMAGAFVFVISSLKIPSVTGSCSHMTGTGLGAILFGPTTAGILGLIVLVFQAILLAHGGLTTLGANTFSMAIAGPFDILCNKFSACTGISFGSRRSRSFYSEVFRCVCTDTASVGSDRRSFNRDCSNCFGILCKTGIKSVGFFKGGEINE